MATEYKCDICGNPATVHITKIIDGKKIKIHLCAKCAEKASFDAMNLPSDIFPKIKELEKQMMSNQPVKANVCPTCGASLSEIENGARFSCPDCYGALGERLFEMFAQMHGATEHKGKSPKWHAPNADEFNLFNKTVENIEKVLGENCQDFLKDAKTLADKLQPKLDKLEASDSPLESTSEQSFDFSEESAKIAKNMSESKEVLLKKLDVAISEERYEDAAKLRDKIKAIS